jgi:hypothetical protein
MKPPDAAGNPRDVCNDPRAQGAGAPGANEPDGKEDAVPNIDDCKQGDYKTPCTEAQKRDVALQILRHQQEEAQRKDAEQRAARDRGANQATQRAAGEAQADKPDGMFGALGDFAKAVLSFVPGIDTAIDYFDLVMATGKLQYEVMGPTVLPDGRANCFYAPAPAQTFCGLGNQMCGTDFAPGGWYQSSAPGLVFASGPPPVRELNKGDRLSHCLCDAMIANYGIAGDRSAISAACPTEEERERHNCIANPNGPTDAIDRKCIRHLFPSLDEDAWRAKICHAKRCPDGQVSFIDGGDGSCDCGTINPTTGRLPPCRATEIALCPPDNPGPCFCQPFDGGTTPNGGDPFCGRDVTTPGFVGAKDALTLVNPTDAFIHQLDGTKRALMLRPGHTSVGMTTFFQNTVPNLGTVLRTEVSPGARPLQGQNVDLQAYCTNIGNNVHNAYMGECRLNSLTPGTFSNCDISLSASVRSDCMTGNFDIEYVLNTATGYTAFTGIGSTGFAGTLTQTPANSFIPACPRPAPDNAIRLVEAVNPNWLRLGGGITNPSVLWTFSTELLGEVPRNVTLLR